MSTVGVDQPDSIGQTSSLEALVERLREVVQDIGAAKVWLGGGRLSSFDHTFN